MYSNNIMKVIKRDGSNECISFDKILTRLNCLVNINPKLNIEYDIIAQKVISQIYDGIYTKMLSVHKKYLKILMFCSMGL